MTGTTQVTEFGFLEIPIMITNTNSVGVVRDAVLKWDIKTNCYGAQKSCISNLSQQKLTMVLLTTFMDFMSKKAIFCRPIIFQQGSDEEVESISSIRNTGRLTPFGGVGQDRVDLLEFCIPLG